MNRLQNGITLVSLVITIIVLLILAGVTIAITLGENGLLNRAKMSVVENTKQEATETMNLKISAIQIQSYTENQKLPNLQYLADKLCEDSEIEYVIKKEKDIASLDKIDVTGVNSIFTKIKKYQYEFEIDSSLRLASIDGVKIANNDTSNDELKSAIQEINLAIKILQNENKELKENIQKLENETIVNKRINIMDKMVEIPVQHI